MTAIASLRIGTRGSPLALAQAEETRLRLETAFPELAGAIAIEVISTTGDRIQDRPLAEIGGKGLFTKEIDQAQLENRVDIAVHSMKDVPTVLPDGLVLAAFLPREDVRDALISSKGRSLADLPEGAVVGSASLRRAAQVLRRRPDLSVIPFRGNVQTRLRKLAEGQVDATLLAMAGLNRLKLMPDTAVPLSVEEMLPAVAQGAIGITCRSDDGRALSYLAALDDAPTRCRVVAERAFLAVLDGSCRTPIAGLALVDGDRLTLTGMILRPDGTKAFDVVASGHCLDPHGVGERGGQTLLELAGPDFLALPV
jgi:hydroxymethylbilane synthase